MGRLLAALSHRTNSLWVVIHHIYISTVSVFSRLVKVDPLTRNINLSNSKLTHISIYTQPSLGSYPKYKPQFWTGAVPRESPKISGNVFRRSDLRISVSGLVGVEGRIQYRNSPCFQVDRQCELRNKLISNQDELFKFILRLLDALLSNQNYAQD